MPSQLTLDSLKALTGGAASTRRVLPTEDYGFSGAVPTQGELESPWERKNTWMAEAANERDLNDAHQAQDLNTELQTYNRPDVTQVREQQKQDALEKLLAPIRLKGQFEVEAAKQSQLGQAQRDERLFGNRMTAQNDAQAANDARAAATAKSIGLRQQIAAKTSQQAKASGGGFLSMLGIGGPSAKDKLGQEIAALMAQDAQLAGAGDTGDPAAAAAATPNPQRMTRKLKNGGVAYSDDGGRTWLQD